jgi:PAS domain S-box-containing protein
MKAALVGELLEAAPDAMVLIGDRGEIVSLNKEAERLFGYSRAELLGQHVQVVITQRSETAQAGDQVRAFAAPLGLPPPQRARAAVLGRKRDGSEFPAEISSSPLDTDEGVVSISAIRDISERLPTHEQLARLNRAQEMIQMRDDFFAVAAHELRTPLTALQLQVDSVLRACRRPDPAEGQRVLVRRAGSIASSLAHLTKLVNQLLDVNRVSGGRLALNVSEVDLSEVVEEAVDQLREQAAQARCDLVFRAAPEPLRGIWDAVRIAEVVTNLVANAITYGGGRAIEVATWTQGGDVVALSVRDHGNGIPAEDQQRIFDRFERMAPQQDPNGFGLGLWITKQIVAAHGGSVRVSSEVGAGSLFTVHLPVVGLEATPTTRRHRPGCRQPVMLIDDDTMVRSAFAEVLQEEGIEVVTAADGAEGLAMLQSGLTPALIFLDLVMPVMDGTAFLERRGHTPRLATIPVVLLSATNEIEQQARSLGVAAFLRKPVTLESLFRAIDEHCRPPAPESQLSASG